MIRRVGIIGAGTMGQGIAQVCAAAQLEVVLYDIKSELIERSIQAIGRSLEGLISKGKLPQQDKQPILQRIAPGTSLKDLNTDLVIEAAVEDLEIKRRIFAELEALVSDDTILTSNTSSISITSIASSLRHSARFAGLHFFNPAPVMRLVEIIQGASTSRETLEKLQAFVKQISKTSVLAQDSPGFIVNRVARHFYVESLKLAEEGVTDFTTIDQLIRNSGFKMGPFELMDLIGMDVNFAVTSSLFEAFHHDPKFRPSRVQEQKVQAGHLGKKTGRGFYDYNS